MPRKNRHDTVRNDSVHHIFHKAIMNCALFREDVDYEYYRSLMVGYKDRYKIAIYNYCLMPNHLHLLVYVSEFTYLYKFIQAVSLAYSAYYRRSYGHSGYLWQGRYKNLSIGDSRHLLECARYIERNPLRSAVLPLSDPGRHRWSSFRYYANGDADEVVTCNPSFEAIGDTDEERMRRYREYILDPRPYEDILDNVFKIAKEPIC